MIDLALRVVRPYLYKASQSTVQGFDPNVGLFRATSDNQLYPSPAAAASVPQVRSPLLPNP